MGVLQQRREDWSSDSCLVDVETVGIGLDENLHGPDRTVRDI